MKHQKPKEMFRITHLITPTFLVFLLSACGPPPAEDCAVVGDEDGNGLSDCQDAACSALPECAPEAICNDAVDNDGDGTTDCQDIDCANNPACLPEVDCADGTDNDIDGLTDCADDDCAGTADCVEADCQDGQDNDTDGDTDCADADCLADVTCIPEGICDDGLDDDLDGDTDCADADCANDPICLALCGNGTLDLNEQCDDGNAVDGDGCNAICQFEFCGDGVINNNGTEECDPPDGTSCDDFCQRIPICGDGITDLPEECDDGNVVDGDTCSSVCLVEATPETEPNEDGTPNANGDGTDGDDFDSVNANGPFSDDVIISATLSPLGDEDVFAVLNAGGGPVSVAFDVFNPALGLGVPCGTTIDTGLNIRDAAGTELASNDDRDGANDRCSTLDFTIQPGETVFAHVVEFSDDDEIPAPGYFLVIDFPVCGDGVLDAGEDCDPPDGVTCDAFCQKIPVCGDNFLDVGEECDPPDGNVTCDDLCQRVPVCGDSLIDGVETCDDGNAVDGDCCSSACQAEAGCEVEPNDDFTIAEGPFIPDFSIRGTIIPVGDQDFFAVELPAPADLRIETFDGTGAPNCNGIDTVARLFDIDGTTELASDDQDGVDSCSLITAANDVGARTLPPGVYFVSVEDFVNNDIIDGYTLVITLDSVCNDGVIEGFEECDPPDGNITCDDLCQRVPVCNDGIVDFPEEECEDGNTADGDGCSAACLFEPQPEVEPNGGIVDALNNGPLTPNVLITGTINPPGDQDFFEISVPLTADIRIETFDETGIGNCGTGHDTRVKLFAPNGSTVLAEDDLDGVGDCSLINPAVDVGASQLAPGNYFVSVEEDGNNAAISGYILVITFDSVCGNGAIEGVEECDPADGVTCDDQCQRIPLCGDGLLDGAETCDPPDGVTCDDQCQRIPTCGDGILDFPEQCDDGNLVDGDGCDADCVVVLCNAGDTLVQLLPADLPQAINSNATITSVIDVLDVGTVQKVFVLLTNIDHTFDGDLDISLLSPAGTSIDLSSDNGSLDDDYIATLLADECVNVNGLIIDGTAPFTGCFAPEGLLDTLIGEASNGTWTLQVTDDAFGDEGSLNAWSLGLCIQ